MRHSQGLLEVALRPIRVSLKIYVEARNPNQAYYAASEAGLIKREKEKPQQAKVTKVGDLWICWKFGSITHFVGSGSLHILH